MFYDAFIQISTKIVRHEYLILQLYRSFTLKLCHEKRYFLSSDSFRVVPKRNNIIKV